MNPDNIDRLDGSKLHTESLQLRSQQFQLATIALTGSGITAWLAPGIIALTKVTIPQAALLVGIMSWLVLLVILFLWSLSLRSLISIISQYLDYWQLSRWEARFREFQKECITTPKGDHASSSRKPDSSPPCQQEDSGTASLYKSQTVFTAYAFAAYGILPVAGVIVTAIAFPANLPLSRMGHIQLLVALAGYLWFLKWKCQRREQGPAIRKVWERVKAKTEKNDS
jgi:hypothetical protein